MNLQLLVVVPLEIVELVVSGTEIIVATNEPRIFIIAPQLNGHNRLWGPLWDYSPTKFNEFNSIHSV